MGRGESPAPDLGTISCDRGGRSASSGHFGWGTASDFGEKLRGQWALHGASLGPAAALATGPSGSLGSTHAARLSDFFFFFIF